VADLPELRESVRETVLDAYKAEYKELADTWRAIELKAQGAVVTAGIFIAAVLAFIGRLSNASRTGERILLTLVTISLMASVLFAIRALGVRRIKAPPRGDDIACLASPMRDTQCADVLEERLFRMRGDVISLWRQGNAHIDGQSEVKAKCLWRAHLCLLSALAFSAVVVLDKSWGQSQSP
jgi:hypothetical protein